MEFSTIISVVTMFVTFICGLIAKKVSWFNNKLIPIQNLSIGLIVAIIEWVITKDFKAAIAVSGLLGSGIYDIGHNLKKIVEE